MAATDPVTAIANALTVAGEIVKPFIDESLSQRYEKEHRQRIDEFLDIISEADSDKRADRLNSFVLRLLGRAGSPASGVARNISIPLDVLTGLIQECSEGIKKDQLLARLEFKRK